MYFVNIAVIVRVQSLKERRLLPASFPSDAPAEFPRQLTSRRHPEVRAVGAPGRRPPESPKSLRRPLILRGSALTRLAPQDDGSSASIIISVVALASRPCVSSSPNLWRIGATPSATRFLSTATDNSRGSAAKDADTSASAGYSRLQTASFFRRAVFAG